MSSFDSGAFVELEEVYQRLLTGRGANPRETWRLIAANRRYRIELESAARRLLRRRGLSAEGTADVAQDALLLLAACLERRPDLGLDPAYGKERFLGWLRAVVRSHCRQVLRRGHARHSRQIETEWTAAAGPTVEWQAELADAFDTLDAPLREVLAAFAELGSIERAAERLGLSPTTTWRRFRKAAGQVRDACGPFTTSDRLVGIPRILKRW